jgi:hypothetical protein
MIGLKALTTLQRDQEMPVVLSATEKRVSLVASERPIVLVAATSSVGHRFLPL